MSSYKRETLKNKCRDDISSYSDSSNNTNTYESIIADNNYFKRVKCFENEVKNLLYDNHINHNSHTTMHDSSLIGNNHTNITAHSDSFTTLFFNNKNGLIKILSSYLDDNSQNAVIILKKHIYENYFYEFKLTDKYRTRYMIQIKNIKDRQIAKLENQLNICATGCFNISNDGDHHMVCNNCISLKSFIALYQQNNALFRITDVNLNDLNDVSNLVFIQKLFIDSSFSEKLTSFHINDDFMYDSDSAEVAVNETIAMMFDKLKTNGNLGSLRITKNIFRDDSLLKNLSELLSTNDYYCSTYYMHNVLDTKGIRHLSLSGCFRHPSYVTYLTDALKYHKSIKCLDLYNNVLNKYIIYIADLLCINTNIEEIRFGKIANLNFIDFLLVCCGWQQHRNMKKFHLYQHLSYQNERLITSYTEQLFEEYKLLLETTEKLKDVFNHAYLGKCVLYEIRKHINSSKLNQIFQEEIRKVFQQNKEIMALYFETKEIPSCMIYDFWEAISTTSNNLQMLEMDCYHVWSNRKKIKPMCKYLSNHPSITHMELTNMMLIDYNPFIESLRNNQTLQVLSLQNHCLYSCLPIISFDFLRDNKTLHTLELTLCDLDNGLSLYNGLITNRTLTHLRISGKFNTQFTINLSKILINNQSLTEFQFLDTKEESQRDEANEGFAEILNGLTYTTNKQLSKVLVSVPIAADYYLIIPSVIDVINANKNIHDLTIQFSLSQGIPHKLLSKLGKSITDRCNISNKNDPFIFKIFNKDRVLTINTS